MCSFSLGRPEITVKLAVTSDFCVDDSSLTRLVISDLEDLEQVDELRSQSDAVLVGAETVRKDNPSLLVKDPDLIGKRVREGRSVQPIGVTITTSGNLPLTSHFVTSDASSKIIYLIDSKGHNFDSSKHEFIEINCEKEPLRYVVQNLYQRGIRKLLVEGGPFLIRSLLESKLVDRFRLAQSSVALNDVKAYRFNPLEAVGFDSLKLESREVREGFSVSWFSRQAK